MSTAEIATIETRTMARPADEEWSVEHMVSQAKKIQECMNAVMVDGEHYGVIPGTQGRDGKPPKKTLLKPGAEKLCLMFRLCPEYETLRAEQTPTLVSYTIRCRLTHIGSGNLVATGLGSCNSREAKYVRAAPKKCPKCGGAYLIVGNPEYERDAAYKGGMLCYAKKGGCGAKYKPGDEAIEKQPSGIADPSDLDNTILKMACKRALVAAVLNGTAASDCFTQDLEDLTEKAAEYTPPKEAPQGTAGKGPVSNAGVPANTGTFTPSAPTPPLTVSTKPPRADTVKHSNVFASDVKVAKLTALASAAGTLCDGGCAVTTERWSKKAGASVAKTTRCVFHTQLAAFKGTAGEPCKAPNELSEEQIDNLIARYEAKLARQEQRAAAEPRLDIAPKPTLADLMAKHMDGDDSADWLHATFGVGHPQELDADQCATAFALLAAFGTDGYDDLESKARSMGKIR